MQRNGESVLVTGGAGFIGSHLVEFFLNRCMHVRVFDNFSTKSMGNLWNLGNGRWKPGPDFEVIQGDIRDERKLDMAVRGMDFIVHQAALVSVPRSIEDPLTAQNINVLGTFNVLLAARKHGIQRLVYASSSAVYGDIDATTWHEGNEGLPLSPYALTKRINESYALLFHRLYGVSSIGLRYFNVYGPRQDPNSDYSAVIPRFIGALLRGERPTVYGTGKQSRDFVYVDDVVEANWLALNAPLEAVGRIYNIGTGVEVTVLELATLLAYLTGMKLAPKYEAARPEDVMRSCASPTLARNMLGFEAPIPLREGLRQTIQWYKNNFSSDACTRFTSCSPHPQLPLRSGCRSS